MDLKHCADNPLPLLGEARIQDALNDTDASLALYKQVLHIEACNVEAMACMAAHHFYTDQPEVALRFYRHAVSEKLNEVPP
jgi:tetratricopeptide repeat protein 8